MVTLGSLSADLMGIFHRERIERHLSQGTKFAVVGGTAAMIEMITVTMLVEVIGVNEAWAGGLSLIPSVTFVFLMNKYFTFKAREAKSGRQVMRFMVVYGFAIMMNYVLYSLFLHGLEVDYRFAKAMAIGIIAAWNYTMSHAFIFKRTYTGL